MHSHVLLLVAIFTVGGCEVNPSKQHRPKTKVKSRSRIDDLDALRLIDPAKAEFELKRFLESNPRDDYAWTILGHTYEALKKVDLAESAYKKALALNSRRYQALTGMGILSRKKGEYDEALRYYQRALEIAPEYAQAYASMLVIALKQKDDALALEYGEKAYSLDKTDPGIAANLAVVYHINRKFKMRDEMTAIAERLGYKRVEKLKKIYSGELTIRD